MTDNPQLAVFLTQPAPRVEYTFRHILGLIGIETAFLYGDDGFDAFAGPVIRYGAVNSQKGLYLRDSAWMWEKDIRPVAVEHGEWDGLLTLFPFSDSQSALPFDIIAGTFYLLSRYEEYLPFTPDQFGRFPASESLLAGVGELENSLVDGWLIRFAKMLEAAFPGLPVNYPQYEFRPTYDIDVAYAYTGRPWWRTAGGYLRDLSSGNRDKLRERTGVLMGSMRDPYDQYDMLFRVHEEHDIEPLWFFLVGRQGVYDKNLPPGSARMKSLIRRIAARDDLGLHPSFASNDIDGGVGQEKALLEEISGTRIIRSRQHYLRMKLPGTYRELSAAGISHDYTMGFADQPGFRAGTSRPFRFFDLEKNEETSLCVHPFSVMDGTLREYMGLGPEEAVEYIRRLVSRLKEVNGVFRPIWHNSSLSETEGWEDWRRVYTDLFNIAIAGK